jgi:hypothetical protein
MKSSLLPHGFFVFIVSIYRSGVRVFFQVRFVIGAAFYFVPFVPPAELTTTSGVFQLPYGGEFTLSFSRGNQLPYKSFSGDLMPMILTGNKVLNGLAGVLMGAALTASAQTAPAPAPTPAPAPAAAPAPADAAPAAPTWSVGTIDFSGFVDGNYSYNANRPAVQEGGNQLYNFDSNADTFSLSAAKLTINHDPDPIGAHVDFLFGTTKKTVLGTQGDNDFIEQAFLSYKPVKAKGFEADFGQFVTSAGAEVIEAKDNWNYSRSLLFAWAIPYYHFGLRTSMPLTKTITAGVQVVNGWNNVTANNGGVTVGIVGALTKPKFTLNANYYTGPSNAGTQKGYRNLFDATLLLTPPGKFNAYLNYDYGQNALPANLRTKATGESPSWQGIAAAVHAQVTAKAALSGRYEYFDDPRGFSTGTSQNINEFTGTYEYKWVEGLLSRVEFRRDQSSVAFFSKGKTGLVKSQSTVTAGFIAFFGPKR